MRFLAKSLIAFAFLTCAPAFAEGQPPARVGRVSYISGTLAFYGPGDADWSAAKVNYPVATGGWFATDPQSRAEIRIGAETIDLAGETQLGIANLRDRDLQIGVTQGRVDINLRQLGGNETAEIDIPRGGLWLLQPGTYDIDTGTADQPTRIAVFEGSARFVGGGADLLLKAGDAVVLSGGDTVSAKLDHAAADDFVKWCRSRDYQQNQLAASYRVSTAMTGFEELDAHGGWSAVPDYGAVWYPKSLPAHWAPYRDGQWVWVEPWGWSWVDAEPWGFAPFHYGRWAYIDDRWGWVPGNFVARPIYAPALVAFIEDAGIGASAPPDAGPPVGWFPLAPGEVYWPSYTRDVAYIGSVNIANVGATRITELTAIARAQRTVDPPPQVTGQQFANRRAATVVPAKVFAESGRVAAAALAVPPYTLEQVLVSPRPPQVMPAMQRSTPATSAPPAASRQVMPGLPARAALPAAGHPPVPPNFQALAPAPRGRRGSSEIAGQPAQTAPAAPAAGQPSQPPNFSRLLEAPRTHSPLPVTQPPAQPAAPATAGRPPGPPNFSHLAPAIGHPQPPVTPPPAQPAPGGPPPSRHAALPPAPQAPPPLGALPPQAAQQQAQQRAAAQAAAQQQAQQRAAAQAAAQQQAQQHAAAQAAAQQQAQQHAAAQAAAQQQAQQRAAAQAAAQQQAQQHAAAQAAAQHQAQQRAAAQAAAQHQAQQQAAAQAAAQQQAQQRAAAQAAARQQAQQHAAAQAAVQQQAQHNAPQAAARQQAAAPQQQPQPHGNCGHSGQAACPR